MRGRKPTPTYLKLLRGNPSHRPLPRGEPMPASAPACPSPPGFLNAYAGEEWARTAPELFRLGLLTKVDTALFAVYCSTYAQWRTATEELAEAAAADPETHGLLIERDSRLIANPLIGIARRAAETMLKVATEFGMTPAARSRITTNPDGPPGKFDGLLA
jgi:P27 family predicted phage terminase small subunit